MDEVFDREEVLTRVGGDRELLAELVELLREESVQLRAAVRAALAAGQPEDLRQAAHKLKGSVAQLAGRAAFSTAEALERLGKSGELEGAGALAERLEQEVAVLLESLERFVAAAEETG